MYDLRTFYSRRHEAQLYIIGEVSVVRIEVTGLGTKRVCIANLHLEIKEGTLRANLAQYGEICYIQESKCSDSYRYTVGNGMRIIVITRSILRLTCQ